MINMLAMFTLVSALYVLQKADKQKKQQQKTIYAIAGVIALIWSLTMLFVAYDAKVGLLPLSFGLTTIGALHSKGSTQTIFGALAIIILLSVVF